MRKFLQHNLNELHVYCRLVEAGLTCRSARFVAVHFCKLINVIIYRHTSETGGKANG